MHSDLYFELKLAVMAIFCILLMLVCSEVGFLAGKKARPRVDEVMRERVTIFESAVLGVLGLLLGFTMSMAVARFDLRRQLVMDEANAIDTTWHRSQILPAPGNQEFANVLRKYVDQRVLYAAEKDDRRLPEERETGERLQDELWSRATAFAMADQRSVPAGLLMQSLNQMIDLEAARWTAFVTHVPQSVMLGNLFLALLSITMIGYGFGLIGKRHMFSTVMLAISISGVLMVITDLDRPREGFIKISQQPMIDVQKLINKSR
jgi:hypothetical protein